MKSESLNPRQKEAVTHQEGPVMVFAGAGSGKTRVIVQRICHLMNNLGIPPWNILAVTFTNRAANEMKNRIEKIVGFEQASKINIGTFHSICARILRFEHKHLNLTSNFSIVTDSEQITRIKQAIQTAGLPVKDFTPRNVVNRISKAKNMFLNPNTLAEQAGFNLNVKWVAQVYEMYEKQLIKDHALDFDDLIIKAVKLLEDNPAIREKYQNRFKYILVDEYQDTNHAQYRLVLVLSKRYNNIMVVGDDDQSIYGWRGAEISNILNFTNDFPGAAVVKLEQNYRSTQVILSVASGLMKNNKKRTQKHLWTKTKGGEKVSINNASDDREEADSIIKQIKNIKDEEDRHWNDFAVFYRTNAQSRLLEEACMTAGVPYRVIGQVGFFNRKEVKDLVAYIRLALNKHDSNACLRIINTPRRGIGRKTQQIIREYAKEHSLDLIDAIEKIIETKYLPSSTTIKIKEFFHLVNELIQDVRMSSISGFVHKLIERTQFSQFQEERNSPETQASLEIIREFASAANEFDRCHQGNIEEFADYLALNQEPFSDTDSTDQINREFVSLLTLHNAKGMEFPIVFISGMNDGLCPYYRSIMELTEDELEEERRIAYVGMTRAKERLFLVSASRRMHMGQYKYFAPSRFLDEIPKEYVCRSDHHFRTIENAKHLRVSAFGKPFASPLKLSHPSTETRFAKGDRVFHQRWGSGLVLDYSGSGAEGKVTVSFDRVGRKKLLAGPARLTKVK